MLRISCEDGSSAGIFDLAKAMLRRNKNAPFIADALTELDDPIYCYVDDEPIGFACVRYYNASCSLVEITRLYVAPEFRRQRYGSEFCAQVMSWLFERMGAVEVVIEVLEDSLPFWEGYADAYSSRYRVDHLLEYKYQFSAI